MDKIEKRVLEEAEYMLKTKQTIRELSKIFKVSKSTVHKDLHERLIKIDKDLSEKVDKILKYHIDIRHIRGGESTKRKYLKMSNC
ncbi:MAG: sporulation transcriptional regulator SpoIIID [Bacilli bacterium]